MNPEVLLSNSPFPPEKTYTLSRNVSAIQILPAEDGIRSRLGLLTQLPEGAEVYLGGPGFDDRTVRVRSGGSSYFIFLEDLELQKKPAASAVAAG
ncbi:MAG: hypothetical protein JOY54_05345 [Acidobacteriaceae bacterium]|nr:hypothetical protein [Acidobacteriaceae bacterium]